MTTLEKAAIHAWRASGDWALFTFCTRCRRKAYCRGRTREKVLCLTCHDETH